MENDVAVGVPLGPRVGGNLDPAEDTAAPRDQRVGVEALPDPQAHGRPSATSHASARARSSGIGDLHVPPGRDDRPHDDAAPLEELDVVGGVEEARLDRLAEGGRHA